jgi:glycosyltransferase involved in cell wall biosynthesis
MKLKKQLIKMQIINSISNCNTMTDGKNRYPVLWALGRKGYMVQYPLLVALNGIQKTLAVTVDGNIYLQNMLQSSQILSIIHTPSDIISAVKFLFHWYCNKRKLITKLKDSASIVHIFMISPWDIFFVNAVKKSGCPIVLTIHDAKQHIGEESFLMDKLRTWTISKSDHVAVLSSHVAQTLQAQPDFNKPISVVPEGLVMRVEPPLQPRIYPGRDLRLLFHGRIHAYKGLNLLLDAMVLLQSQGCQYSLTIAGSGDLAPYQTKIAQMLKVNVHNAFMTDEELLRVLATHDVCILPYIEASQSAVAVDALWAALPSIATPIGALPQQFKHGVDALIIESCSVDALAQAIHKLCGDKILYESLSRGAYASYRANGPQKAAEQWIQLYNVIIDNQKR